MMRCQRRRASGLLGLCSGAFLALLAGCGAREIVKPGDGLLEGYDAAVKSIQADPLAFLKESLVATRNLKQFTCEFWRQERLGPLSQLRPAERIAANYRPSPLSIRFIWLNEDSEYNQCAYIQGKHDDKVLLLPRVGLLGLPPTVQEFPPSWAVLWGKSKFPITDFGPRRMMEKTIDRIEKAEKFGGVKMAVPPPRRIGPMQEPCFHIELRYPEGDPFRTKLQDLYIHVETRLPVATFLWLPGRDERCTETLDAMYEYGGVTPVDTLADADFEIKEIAAKKVPKGKKPKSSTQPADDRETPSSRPAASED